MTANPQDLHRTLAENPGAVIEDVARSHGATCRAVVKALPAETRRFAPAAFAEAMADLAEWGDVTVIVHTEDGIMEFTGPVPPGKVSHGYFNLMGRTGFHGHIRHERCAGLAFIERQFMARHSAALLFFNHEGGIMLKVYVGRDEAGQIRPDQLARFHALADRLAAAP